MVEMVPTSMTQSATLSHMWLSSLKLNQVKVQSSIMPAIFQVFHSHPVARSTTPHGMGLVSCGKSRQVFVNGCVVLKGLKTEASSTVVHFAVLPKASCFMVSGDSWAPFLPHIHGNQGAESWISLLFIPPGHCKTFQCRGGAAQEAITIPPRLLPGSSQAHHSLKASQLHLPRPTHTLGEKWSCTMRSSIGILNSLEDSTGCLPFGLKIVIEFKVTGKQDWTNKSLWTIYCICHRFNLLRCFQILMGTSVTLYLIMAVHTHENILAFFMGRVQWVPFMRLCPEGSQPA